MPRTPAPAHTRDFEEREQVTGVHECTIRPARREDERAAYQVCLGTGDHGRDATALYREDPDALGRIFVGPYLAFELECCFVLEDKDGVCGYVLGAMDSRGFYDRYDREWRPALCRQFADPGGLPEGWTPLQHLYHAYHHPDYFCPEPYDAYPSHLHIDLLPRAQGRGFGRRMIAQLLDAMHRRGSPGVHLGLSALNTGALAFYTHLGFRELTRVPGDGAGTIYMGVTLARRSS
jgi:ribosomal protein S18 acetylase RimI-like enzyme